MSLQNGIAAAQRRIVDLLARAQQIAGALPHIPQALQISDKDMHALQTHIAALGCRALGVPQLDPGVWRPFWSATYDDWDRSKSDAYEFWSHAQHHLRETERFLNSLTSAAPCPRCPTCGSLV